MTARASGRATATPGHRARTAVLATGVVCGALLVAAGGAAADQTVWYDDAGPAPHISLVGDSTLTGVRWYSDYGALRRYNFVLSAESCRRTIERSCVSREGYRSETVIEAMRSLDGDLGELLVVMSGYNDPAGSIDDAIAGVLDEARDQGVGHVVWLDLRTSQDVDYSDPQEQSSIETFRAYNTELLAAAAGSGGYLQVADWATHSDGADAWFEADGVHLTPTGVDALTTFIADAVDRVLAGEQISPATPPWTMLLPGAEGDVVVAVQRALREAGLELPGGIDGVYGDATMVAVAAFQRAHALGETGVVDVETAQALGVHTDPAAAATPEVPAAPPATAAPTTTAAPAAEPVVPAADRRDDGRTRALVALAALVALVAAVLARRRSVVARRAARRRARVHPAASPRRSVADLRRAGLLPPAPGATAAVYDHERDGVDTATGPTGRT